MIPYIRLFTLSILSFITKVDGNSIYDSRGIPIVMPDDGVPTCDPAGYYTQYPYSGYRISLEVRVPQKDTKRLSELSYNTLINSHYEKFFVLSVCDMNFVTGELGIPVSNHEDIWNKTICSDIIPLGFENEDNLEDEWHENLDDVNAAMTFYRKKISTGVGGRLNDQSKLEAKNHPYFDMFLNYRTQMFHRNEPDVRPQYCFHTAKAQKFLENGQDEYFRSKLTPEWDRHLLTNSFVGGLFDCYENNITTYDPMTGDIVCGPNNIRPVLPLYRDNWPYMWTSIVVNERTDTEIIKGNAQSNEDEEFGDEQLEWAVRIPWLYTPDVYDNGFPKVMTETRMVLQPSNQAFKRITMRKLYHDPWVKNVNPFEKMY
ncbi:uncharacterized protein SAPINGB_P001172 [Magnusiomyces paraingens]|uniref:Uncharacterized protein n=1 Tax=Magnusiomyces paraingens TaxID=2606893 RepID=A0A5E8B4X8_9ASCO|nr:uncharacterized protein SAPINGB_P001172 [Saprochaete ingens]VVT46355.1 unnamed protein product [Saprochaete ingens]